MKFKLEFEVDNDFYRMAENPEEIDTLAVSMTIKDVAEKVRSGSFHIGHTESVRDENGSRVGGFKITED